MKKKWILSYFPTEDFFECEWSEIFDTQEEALEVASDFLIDEEDLNGAINCLKTGAKSPEQKGGKLTLFPEKKQKSHAESIHALLKTDPIKYATFIHELANEAMQEPYSDFYDNIDPEFNIKIRFAKKLLSEVRNLLILNTKTADY